MLRLCIGVLCVCNLVLVLGFRDMRSLDHQLSALTSLLLMGSMASLSSEQSNSLDGSEHDTESISDQLMRKHLRILNWGILLARARAAHHHKKTMFLTAKMYNLKKSSSADQFLRKSVPRAPIEHKMRGWKSWSEGSCPQ